MKSSNVIKSFKKWITLSTFIPFAISLFCTGDDPVTGTVTETDTGITAKIYNPDGITPASGAIVKIFEANDTSRNAIKQVLTDAKGEYSIKGISAGRYSMYAEKGNLIAYQDSIIALDDTVLLQDDTLETAKRVTAIVGMQPNHNPQGVTVQIIGSEFYANVDDNAGHFTFDKLANGTYRLKLETYYEGYTTTYKTITISPTTPDTLPDTLWMIYTGIPVVRDISAQYDTLNGQVLLKWKKTDYKDFQQYLIYRDYIRALTLSAVPIAVTTDTNYTDTIYRLNLHTGEHSSLDTTVYAYNYRIAIRNSSQFTGVAYKQTNVTAVPPSLVKSAFSFITKHIPLNIVSGKSSVNDSIQYNVIVSNPTRNLKKIIWRDFYKNQIIKETITDTTKKTSSDSVVYLWHSIGIRQLECSVIDAAGTVWNDTVSFTIVPDFPKVIVSSTTPVVGVNDTILMQSTVSDTFGIVTKWEWSGGDTSNWVEGSIDAVIIAPQLENLSYPVFVRVTDDDENKVISHTAIRVEARVPLLTHVNDTTVSATQTNSVSIAVNAIDVNANGKIIRYYWDIGLNGVDDSTNTGTYTFSTASGYKQIIRWGARDDDNNIVFDTFNLRFNRPPTDPTFKAEADWGIFDFASCKGMIQTSFSADDPDELSDSFDFTLWKISNENNDWLTKLYTGKHKGFNFRDVDTLSTFKYQLVIRDSFGDSIVTTGSFTTPSKPNLSGIFDPDSNYYSIVKIGNQIWTKENLRTTKFNDGTLIPHVTDKNIWTNLSAPAYDYWFSKTDIATQKKWGAFYNWYAVNTGKLAPEGWHVPTSAEWDTLQNYLIKNGYNFDGTFTDNKIAKSMCAKSDWYSSYFREYNTNNSTYFSAIPSGYRSSWIGSDFQQQNYIAAWWTSTEGSSEGALLRSINGNNTGLFSENNRKMLGLNVRLVKSN